MKITRRIFSRPMASISIFAIPLMQYIILKIVGSIKPEREWIWWLALPLLFTVWFFINFKIVRNNGINR